MKKSVIFLSLLLSAIVVSSIMFLQGNFASTSIAPQSDVNDKSVIYVPLQMTLEDALSEVVEDGTIKLDGEITLEGNHLEIGRSVYLEGLGGK